MSTSEENSNKDLQNVSVVHCSESVGQQGANTEIENDEQTNILTEAAQEPAVDTPVDGQPDPALTVQPPEAAEPTEEAGIVETCVAAVVDEQAELTVEDGVDTTGVHGSAQRPDDDVNDNNAEAQGIDVFADTCEGSNKDGQDITMGSTDDVMEHQEAALEVYEETDVARCTGAAEQGEVPNEWEVSVQCGIIDEPVDQTIAPDEDDAAPVAETPEGAYKATVQLVAVQEMGGAGTPHHETDLHEEAKIVEQPVSPDTTIGEVDQITHIGAREEVVGEVDVGSEAANADEPDAGAAEPANITSERADDHEPKEMKDADTSEKGCGLNSVGAFEQREGIVVDGAEGSVGISAADEAKTTDQAEVEIKAEKVLESNIQSSGGVVEEANDAAAMPKDSGGDETMATTEGMIVNEINSVNIPSATVEIPERHQGPEGSDAQANTCAEASGAVENVHGDDVTANSPGEGFCETTAEQREGATVSGRILQTTDEEGRANAESTDYEPGSNNSLQVVPKATDNSSLSLPRGETTASPPTVGRVKPLVNPSPGARQPHVTPHTVASGSSNKSSEMKDPKLGKMTPAHRLEAVGNKDEHATSLGLRPTTHTSQVVPTHQFNRRGIYGSGGSDNSQYVLGEVRNGCNLTPAEEYNCFRIRNRVSANYKGPIHVVEEIHVSCAYCGCPVDTVTRVQAGGLSYHPQCIACKLCGTNSLTEAYFQITDKSAVCSECGARGLAGQVFCEEAMERGRYARAFRQKINGLIERYDLRDRRRTPQARREDGVIPPTLVLNTNREYGKNSNTRRSQLIQRQLYYSQNDNNIICLLESPSPQRSPGRSQRLPSLR